MSYEVLSTLGRQGTTRLAMRDGRRKVVLRALGDGAAPFLPERTPEAVLPLIELADVQGRQHAVYDYVPGVTLKELLEALRDAGQAIPLGLVARVVADAARAVGELHGTHPPVPAHGGLGDAALLVGFDGAVRVLDYGAARSSRHLPSVAGNVSGDVFALGAVLHAALTDFAGSYADAVDEGVPLPPPSSMHSEATPALDDVVGRALSRAFARRQVDGTALADELEAVLGDALFTRAQVAEVVGGLFAARRGEAGGRAVHIDASPAASMGDDAAPTGAHPAPWLRHDATQTGHEPVRDVPAGQKPAVRWVTGTTGEDLPAAAKPIGAGTEPGRPGPFAALRGADPEGTSPGVPLPTRPQPAPPPAREPAPPSPPREAPPADEAPPLETAEPTRPRASVPRRPEAAKSPPPALDAAPPDETRPRARVPIEALDTNPRAPAPLDQDTNPRADPAALRPRNTSTHERLRAAGQERIPTPPVGVPAAPSADDLGAPITDEPTNVRRRPAPPSSEGDLPQTAQVRQPNRARAVIAVLLLLMAAGLGAVALRAPHRLAALKVKLGLAPPPDEAPDEPPPPDATEADGDAGAPALAATDVDAGEDPEEEDDGGVDDEADAGAESDAGPGADAGVPDGGRVTADAGAATRPPDKSPPKKKKKRRRR